MEIKIGDMLYDSVGKRTAMVTDRVSYGWRVEWSNGQIEYMWTHTVDHHKQRWEWLKVDIANGRQG